VLGDNYPDRSAKIIVAGQLRLIGASLSVLLQHTEIEQLQLRATNACLSPWGLRLRAETHRLCLRSVALVPAGAGASRGRFAGACAGVECAAAIAIPAIDGGIDGLTAVQVVADRLRSELRVIGMAIAA
jgi:hypothetical protein